MMDDRVFNGAGDLDLVGAQVDLTGMRPGDRAAADGEADRDESQGRMTFFTTKGHEGSRMKEKLSVTRL